jgi:hypothetical protein
MEGKAMDYFKLTGAILLALILKDLLRGLLDFGFKKR